MKPVRQIELSDWMRAKETLAVIAALASEGQEVRFVGGCVRDALHARKESDDVDIDIATPDHPEQVIRLLDKAGIKSIPTGLAHGTITAVVNHKHFEITTLRVDVETHGRHADVAFTDNWEEDAARRDFTMNALFCSPEGEIYDPWSGIADLEAGRVRFVGEAMRRIKEDHLRLLRFFRFHAWYGKGPPDEEGLAAAKVWAKSLAKLSGERIRVEMLKLLAASDPVMVVAAMDETGILAEAIPGAGGTKILHSLLPLEENADPLRRLAALLRPHGDVAAVSARLRLSRAEQERLTALLAPPGDISAEIDERALRRALYRYGSKSVTDWLLLDEAESGGSSEGIKTALATVKAWYPIELPIKGKDVLALGLSVGPEVGEAIRDVEDWWVKEDFAPGREDCLVKLCETVAARDS